MEQTIHTPIALAEDNPVNRNSFVQKMELLPEYRLLFTAVNGKEFLDNLKKLSYNNLPKAVFIDLEMPEMNGIQAIAIAKSLYPDIEFIVLTVFDDDTKIFEAIRAGASGYLLKHASAQNLKDALISVLEFGGVPMSPSIARKALQLLSDGDKRNQTVDPLPPNITPREKEILKHMVRGWDAKRIADELFISVMTVRKHIANIYQKLHVSSQAQIISVAYQQKWFKPD
jgi:DNA-binding NarL/FixJ family response regulator